MGLVLVALSGHASIEVTSFFALAQLPMYMLPALLEPLYRRLLRRRRRRRVAGKAAVEVKWRFLPGPFAMSDLEHMIDAAWETRSTLSPQGAPAAVREAVGQVIAELDAGRLRVAEKIGGAWTTHQWLKKAVLLSFRLADNRRHALRAARRQRRAVRVLRQGADQVRRPVRRPARRHRGQGRAARRRAPRRATSRGTSC